MVLNEPTKKIAMVVDDDPVTQTFLRSVFVDMGYDVIFANNGREAASFFRGNISVITMDHNMPEMSGIEATKAIRKRENAARADAPVWIVGLTVHDDQETLAACLDAGMNHVITKPVSPDQLKAYLSRI
ncbi:MAG: response regulator [Gammaproteobacteria bacterium]|nr:response regulator [Gammaproteobacteria bacterium]